MNHRLGALRVAARLARRDARRAKGRTALVAVLVGLPVFAGTAGGALLLSMIPTDATYARYVLGPAGDTGTVIQARVGAFLGPDVTQSIRGDRSGWSTVSTPPSLAEHERAVAAVLPDGDRLLRMLSGTAAFATPERAVPGTTDVVALPSDGDLSGVFPVEDGALPRAADELALSLPTAERLGVGVGDTVTMTLDGDARTTTVTGTLARVVGGPRVVAGPGAIPPPEDAAAPGLDGVTPVAVDWFVVGPAAVTWDDVRAVNRLGSVVTSRAVLLDPPPADEVPAEDDAPVDAGTVALVGGLTALVLLETVLLIGPAFAVGARRQERQLALLAAAGAERRTLRDVVLLTGVVTGLAAAGGGAAAGLATAAAVRAVVAASGHPYTFPDLRVPWLPVLGFAAFGTAAATLAAWLPSLRAARVDVVAALTGRRPPVRHGRRLTVVGGIVAAVGAAAAALGATATQPTLLVAGVVALELGAVAAAGALVSLAARLAPRLGAIGRIALRDAARHRSRTAPAVAAVLAAVAGITAGAVYLQSEQARNAAQYAPFAAVGTVAIEIPDAETLTPDEMGDLLDAATAAVEQHLPASRIEQVNLAAPVEQVEGSSTWIAVHTPPAKECPLWADGADRLSAGELADLARDERCRERGGSGQIAWMPELGWETLVDDGTVVAALGYPDSSRAAAALAEGRAVVWSDRLVGSDGTVRIAVESADADTELAVPGPTVDVPADVVPLPGSQYGLILPPQALDALGLEARPVGLVVSVPRPPTPAEEAALSAELGEDAYVHVERGNPFRPGLALLLLVVAAVVVGLGATGISVVLAATESRPDLATLAAIGAEPRARRRFTAAQATVISGLGTTVGVLAGLALGWVLVTAQRYRWDMPDYTWELSVPWVTVLATLVAVPLLASAVGYAATRSRLPVVRRLAG